MQTINLYRQSFLETFSLALRNILRMLAASLTGNSESTASPVTVARRFDDILRTHGSLISRICYSYATDSEDFKDLRQDVLINIWRGLGTFRGESSSLTWLYRVTLNTCVSTVRKRSRRPATERIDLMPIDIADEPEDEELRERFERLHALIAALSPVDKAIMTMWLDDRSYEEIAEVVGVSKNTVGLRLHRIKERWKVAARGEGAPPPSQQIAINPQL